LSLEIAVRASVSYRNKAVETALEIKRLVNQP